MEGHCTSEKPPFRRRQPVLPRASPAPHCARCLARVARLRATTLSLSGDEAQHGRFRCARAAPRWRHSVHTLWEGTARARGRRSFGATPVLPRASPAPHCARWLAACSALARHCARSLWGRGPARALPTRARAAPSRRHSLNTPWKGTARAKGRRSVGARPLLSRASFLSHCAWWLARVARLRATALALSGDEAQHGRFRRARAAPRWRHLLHAPWKGTARARSRRSFGASPCSHVPALPLTARGGLRV
jgi:hypothetical protein